MKTPSARPPRASRVVVIDRESGLPVLIRPADVRERHRPATEADLKIAGRADLIRHL